MLGSFLKAFRSRMGLIYIGLALLIGTAGISSHASAQNTPDSDTSTFPYSFPVPDGWRQEIVAFPLSFAPELDYAGHGDVRFSPGMFTPGAEDFWTYGFVWWVPLETEITAARLSADMNAYFSGLAKRVTEGQGRELPHYEAAAIYFDYDHITGASLLGRVKTLDAFATHAPIALNAQVDELVCAQHKRKAIRFAFSPQPFGHAQWDTLEQVIDHFTCDKP